MPVGPVMSTFCLSEPLARGQSPHQGLIEPPRKPGVDILGCAPVAHLA